MNRCIDDTSKIIQICSGYDENHRLYALDGDGRIYFINNIGGWEAQSLPSVNWDGSLHRSSDSEEPS